MQPQAGDVIRDVPVKDGRHFLFSKRWEGTERRFAGSKRVFLIWRWVLLGQDVIPEWQPNSFGLPHNHGSGKFP